MLPLSIRKVQPQVVDIRKVLGQVLELVRFQTKPKGIRVSVELPPGDFSVFGDPHELHQVYLNILINAVDAIGREGEIRVGGRLEPAWVITWIEDNGCGMTEEQISEAFDLFYTTKDAGEGTGLGLSIVHNIVENHGGAVSIRSRPGEGTTVEIRLPYASR
jgi:signal transduction histidine kinase